MIRYLLAMLICSATIAAGQVTARFYLDKEKFAPGEPVFLNFEVTNHDSRPARIVMPESPCGQFKVSVSSDPSATSFCALPSKWFMGTCPSRDIPAGEIDVERILLNVEHRFAAPGYYDVTAGRHLLHTVAAEDYDPHSWPALEVRDELHFLVSNNLSFDSAALSVWTDRLKSSDYSVRIEAAKTLASLAPSSLEDTLIGFVDDDAFRPYVPMALARLNSPRSMAALAALLREAKPGSAERQQSTRYLARSEDPQWFPVVKQAGHPYDAAESGGDQALPYLRELMHSEVRITRMIAISALAYTGSRDALPILLDLLNSPDNETSERAAYSLERLTHLKAQLSTKASYQAQYPQWLRWWLLEGAAARIYKASECGESSALPSGQSR